MNVSVRMKPMTSCLSAFYLTAILSLLQICPLLAAHHEVFTNITRTYETHTYMQFLIEFEREVFMAIPTRTCIQYGMVPSVLYTVRNVHEFFLVLHTDPPTIWLNTPSIYDPIDLRHWPIALLKP